MKHLTYKILTILFLLPIIVAVNSCNKRKIELNPDVPTENEYFTTENQFSSAVFGIYSGLGYLYAFGDGLTAGIGNTINSVTILPGDDITISSSDELEVFGSIQPSSGRIGGLFRSLYLIIGRANVVLQKLEEESGAYNNADLKKYHKGEALFLRGYSYLNLWTYFGAPPLITERIANGDEAFQPSSSGNALLDQAIKDFTEAESLLPANWDAANRGRATANSARGFLGKALVFRASATNAVGDYTSALAAINKITGISLVNNYADNFAYDTENNAESLFEFQASQPSAGNLSWVPRDSDPTIGGMAVYWGFYSNDFSLFGAPPFKATTKYVNAFEAGDPRQNISLAPATKAIKKYVTRDLATNEGITSLNNARILRYADVLLLKAEAILGSNGSLADAVAAINQVRSRARNMVGGGTVPANRTAVGATAQQVFDWIVSERLVELGAEGHRWPDLRRWALGNKISLNNSYFNSERPDISFSTKNLYFPIPSSEIDRNPNVVQNAGY
jgi:hypothetical protein